MISTHSKPTCALIGAGFIGTSLITRLTTEGYSVKVLTRSFSTQHLQFQSVSFFYGDFSDSNLLERVLTGCDVAIHLISSTVPCDLHIDFPNDLRENLFSTISFLELCSKQNVDHVLFASSASVYGDPGDIEYLTELSLTNPISSHGMQKLSIEKYLIYYSRLFSLNVHILRISNPFGPLQNIDGRQGFIAMVIGYIKKCQPVPIRSEGTIIRDFLFVDNVSFAFQFCIDNPHLPSIINVSSGEGRSLSTVLSDISCLSDVNISTIQLQDIPTDIVRSILQPCVLLDNLPSWPPISFSEGLISTLKHHSLYPPGN